VLEQKVVVALVERERLGIADRQPQAGRAKRFPEVGIVNAAADVTVA
jgi:hypothetical protein